MKTSEKVAYIKGLMEGLALDDSKPETKILKQIADVLEELADCNNALIEENIKLKDYIEALDSDLGDLEEYVYDIGAEDDEDDDFYDYGFEDDEDEDGDEDIFEEDGEDD